MTWGFFKRNKTRQQSTLAQQRGRTTIDGRRLNERVRYGNVCFPSPMITGNSKCAHNFSMYIEQCSTNKFQRLMHRADTPQNQLTKNKISRVISIG